MSVLACNRTGCGGVMCDRYSHRHGYLCDSCFDELCRMPIGMSISDFMDDHREESPDLTEFYDEEFPIT